MFNKISKWRERKSPWINRYTIVFCLFIIWMLFFDRHNVFAQHFLIKTVNRLESEKMRYDKGVEETRELRDEINNNVEKYARERYYMHKSDEEVFVFK